MVKKFNEMNEKFEGEDLSYVYDIYTPSNFSNTIKVNMNVDISDLKDNVLELIKNWSIENEYTPSILSVQNFIDDYCINVLSDSSYTSNWDDFENYIIENDEKYKQMKTVKKFKI